MDFTFYTGSTHRKTGPGKLLETQLAHSFVGRLVYSFSDAAWRTIDFCANGAAIRLLVSAPGHTECVLSRSFRCQMYTLMPHTHSCAQNMLHILPASAVIFLGISSNKNTASYVCELFPNSSLIELWGKEPTRKVTQTNVECERLSHRSNLLLAVTCHHPRFGGIKKYLFTKNPGPNFTLYAKNNLTEAKGLNLRHQTKKENGRKGSWTWHRTIGTKRRKR